MAKEFGPSPDVKRVQATEPAEPMQLAELRAAANSSTQSPESTKVQASPEATQTSQSSTPQLDGSLFSGGSHDLTRELQRRLASRLERAQAQALEKMEEKLGNSTSSNMGAEIAPQGLRQKLLSGIRKLFPHDRQSIIGKFVWWLGDALVKLEKLFVKIVQAFLRLFGLRFGNHISFQRSNPQQKQVPGIETKKEKKKR